MTKEVNGTWTAHAYYCDYGGGRRREKKRCFETEAEAEQKCERVARKNSGAVHVTFGKFVETYSADMMPRILLNTLLTKESIIKSKIMPWFCVMRMDEIKPIDVVRWQNSPTECRQKNGKGFSVTYLRTVNTTCSWQSSTTP
ncbi:N-terminal phage integrase SAM-like domain-containing protein [Trueperella abortisuis]|uniref:N-terminal phage integrase SAM-like domain-containing protein n=1 Tax=Trueperella abortisuis TaxID=445930 RepID=UPI00289314FE|nr:N-terminal phage integrase SAM-like domain-containing protein [Trueperella abortisuis]